MSCATQLYNSRKIDTSIRWEYINTHPKDKFIKDIYNGTPKTGMNVEQLIACISRKDIDSNFKEDIVGTYIYEYYYIIEEWKSSRYSIGYDIKYYFSNDTLTRIIENRDETDMTSKYYPPPTIDPGF
jgi:hypothetical protein